MSGDDLSLLQQAQGHAAKQALDAVEKDKLGQVAFEATSDKTLEASIQGERGRLKAAAYAKIVFGATKEYIAGVRGVWTLRKK